MATWMNIIKNRKLSGYNYLNKCFLFFLKRLFGQFISCLNLEILNVELRTFRNASLHIHVRTNDIKWQLLRRGCIRVRCLGVRCTELMREIGKRAAIFHVLAKRNASCTTANTTAICPLQHNNDCRHQLEIVDRGNNGHDINNYY